MNDSNQRRVTLAAAVGAVLAMGSLGAASTSWAQQPAETRAGSDTASDAARELREAQQQVKEAGREVADATAESREAVREGREAGRAAQAEARESARYAEQAPRDGERTPNPASGEGTSNSAGETARTAESTRTAAAGSASSGTGAQRGSGSAPDAVWLLVPVAVSTQTEKQSKDCWVRLYSGQNFDGRYVTITGPAEVAELRSPYGTGLNNWESAVVGRNATVLTYDDDDFEDRSATLRGGERYPDLGDSKLGLFQDIESLRVTCDAPGQGAASGRSSDATSSSGTQR